MAKILVTGGTGYIGSHTLIALLEAGRFEVLSVDNFSNSSPKTLERIAQITGKEVRNYEVDLTDYEGVKQIFSENPDITGVIHFAALKAVGESVEIPLAYYRNNLGSLMNLLDCCQTCEVPSFLFSSSCTVYGNTSDLPVTEESPTVKAFSPYGNTKLMGEYILEDQTRADSRLNAIALRYFNPVGAHQSGLNGEDPRNKPNNLVPIITRVAAGLMPKLTVFGDDYATRDGSAIRDYIHVMDIAEAHVAAIEYLIDGRNSKRFDFINLGTGKGVSVFEVIQAFEEATGQKLTFEVGARRAGDVEAVYSGGTKAQDLLGWEPQRTMAEAMGSAWKWQQTLLSEKEINS